MVDLSVVDVTDKWVCPDDRQLALRGRLETGWSTYADNISKRQRSLEVSHEEQKRIRIVLDKAESMRLLEEERIGAMVEKLDNMKKNVIGDGLTTCIVCGTKTGLMKEALKRCSFCSRVACPKCSVAYPLNSTILDKQLHQCVLCYEERELWKRSGAWFLKSIPAYVIPDGKSKAGGDLRDSLGPSPSLLRGSWHVDAAGEQSEESSDESDVQEAASSSQAFTMSSDQVSLRSFQHWTHGIDVESGLADDDTRSNYLAPPSKRHERPSSDEDDLSRSSDHDVMDGDQSGGSFVHSSSVITERKMSKGRFKPFRKRSKDSHGKENSSHKSESMEVLHANGTGDRLSLNHSGSSLELTKTPNTAKREFYGPLGVVEFTMQYDEGTLELLIIVTCGKELKAMDHGKSSDPYVKTHLLPGASKSTKKRTQTLKKTLNPVWNETLVYHGISAKDIESKSVRLSVMDENKMTSNEIIGETVVHLRSLLTRPVQHFRRLLDPQTNAPSLEDLSLVNNDDENVSGRIEVALHYLSKKQKLVVGVIRCEGLKAMDANGYSDPYVKCYLKPDPMKKTKRKTSVKKKTLNPQFNEEFTYDTPHHELAKKSLEISVWDHDVGRTNDFIGGVTLGIGSGGEALKHWFETLKTSDRRVIRWHTLSPTVNNGNDGD